MSECKHDWRYQPYHAKGLVCQRCGEIQLKSEIDRLQRELKEMTIWKNENSATADTFMSQVKKLQRELAETKNALRKANAGFEEHERKWYLEQDAHETLRREVVEVLGPIKTALEESERAGLRMSDITAPDYFESRAATMGDLRRAKALVEKCGKTIRPDHD